jgi:hypothetical protein
VRQIKCISVTLALLLAACNASTPQGGHAPSVAGSETSDTTSNEAPQGENHISPLENVLTVFAANHGSTWESFKTISGVQWRDPAPLENPDAKEAFASRYRTGNILLAGFGAVTMPDGKVGLAAGSKQDNEGDSGITLNGDARSVHSVAVMKFYPSEHYLGIIQRQLDAHAKVALMADQCRLDDGATTENTQKNAFYQIKLGEGALLYAEAYVDTEGGKYSPGSTTFVFYKDKPMKRISSMGCREAELG